MPLGNGNWEFTGDKCKKKMISKYEVCDGGGFYIETVTARSQRKDAPKYGTQLPDPDDRTPSEVAESLLNALTHCSWSRFGRTSKWRNLCWKQCELVKMVYMVDSGLSTMVTYCLLAANLQSN